MQPKVLIKAKEIINTIRGVSQENNLWYSTPLVNFTKEFVVVFEWWHYQKKVTLCITEEGIEYIACGESKSGIYKVQCGKLKSDTELRNIWVWLATTDFATELEKKSVSISEEDAKQWREIILSELIPDFPDF